MKLEDQVASLELCKKLKELGVRRESVFYWCRGIRHRDFGLTGWCLRGNKFVDENEAIIEKFEKISAFTVAELGEMLPREVRGFDLLIRPADGSTPLKWHIGYVENDYEGYDYRFERQASDNLANAMARMLIHLIEQGIVNPKES